MANLKAKYDQKVSGKVSEAQSNRLPTGNFSTMMDSLKASARKPAVPPPALAAQRLPEEEELLELGMPTASGEKYRMNPAALQADSAAFDRWLQTYPYAGELPEELTFESAMEMGGDPKDPAYLRWLRSAPRF